MPKLETKDKMKLRFLITITLIAILTAFRPTEKKTINLDFGFNVTVGQSEDFGDFSTYTYFELTKGDQKIYIDNSLTEYEFGDKLYPIVLKTNLDSYELLFEINDRPNKNYLKRLFIKNDTLFKEDKLPTFITRAKDLDNDGVKEYAGFWDYAQVWGENNNLTAYNPIIYYEFKNNGQLQIDSILTIERNKAIYGQFHGFSFSEEKEQSTNSLKLFSEELDKIENEN